MAGGDPLSEGERRPEEPVAFVYSASAFITEEET